MRWMALKQFGRVEHAFKELNMCCMAVKERGRASHGFKEFSHVLGVFFCKNCKSVAKGRQLVKNSTSGPKTPKHPKLWDKPCLLCFPNLLSYFVFLPRFPALLSGFHKLVSQFGVLLVFLINRPFYTSSASHATPNVLSFSFRCIGFSPQSASDVCEPARPNQSDA